jgi:RimJ/RimL family protein N-acetyltransferase
VRAWLRRRAEDDRAAFFVIADARDDRALGFIQARDIDPLHRVAELGICIDQPGRGRGLGRQAMVLLEEYLVAVFRVRKIWLRVDAHNAPAVALYRSNGFREVGTLKKHHYAGGRYRDVLLMEKLLRGSKAAGR